MSDPDVRNKSLQNLQGTERFFVTLSTDIHIGNRRHNGVERKLYGTDFYSNYGLKKFELIILLTKRRKRLIL